MLRSVYRERGVLWGGIPIKKETPSRLFFPGVFGNKTFPGQLIMCTVMWEKGKRKDMKKEKKKKTFFLFQESSVSLISFLFFSFRFVSFFLKRKTTWVVITW